MRRVFGLASGEGRQTIRFAVLSMLWAFGSACLDTLSDGLFLEKIGAEHLPMAFLSIALGMIGVSSLVLYSLKVTSPYRILSTAITLGVGICIASSYLVGADPPIWVWYGIKIAARMFFAVMIACSWTFIDQYHDLQDAKRVYSIYSAAYFFGTICAGTLIHFAFASLGLKKILILAAISIGAAGFQAYRITRKTQAVHDDTTEGVFSGSRDSFGSIAKLIVKSKFAILLLLMSLVLQLLITVTECNYMSSFARTLNTAHAGEIASFLGECRAIISACNMLFGVFLYGRFVRRLGLTNAVLITPLFFAALYGAWIFNDALWIAVLGLVAVDGILFTVEDNCFNLLSNAVPTKLKSRVRIVNDSFFEPVGMLLSSLLLLVVTQSFLLGLILTTCVLVLALAIRAIYSDALIANLKENAIRFDNTLKTWLSKLSRRESKETKEDIFDALKSSDDETRLLGIEAMLLLEESLSEALLTASRLGTMGKIKFIRLIEQSPFARDHQVIELIDSWNDPTESPELAKWASLYLAACGLHHPEKAAEELEDPDLFVKAAAILTMKNSPLPIDALDRTIAAKQLDLLLKSGRIDAMSMGLDILAEEETQEAFEQALLFLDHESIVVKRAAARAIAKLAGKALARHAPILLDTLDEARDNAVRLSILEALGKINDSTTAKDILLESVHLRPNERRKAEEIIARMGLKIVPLLLTWTKDLAMPDRARILAGKILAKLALPQLQANLIDILDIEIERAYFYFYFGHTIQKEYPLYDLEMLENAFLTGYQSVIDFIIHLLGAAGSLEDPELLVRALHSKNGKVHAHAIESLSKTCSPRIFHLIEPLVDDWPLQDKMDACLAWQGDYPKLSLSELLNKLATSPSLYDRIVSARLKAKLQMPNWRASLREQMKHSDETFHQYAYELLEKPN